MGYSADLSPIFVPFAGNPLPRIGVKWNRVVKDVISPSGDRGRQRPRLMPIPGGSERRYARQDLNLQPLAPEASALSN